MEMIEESRELYLPIVLYLVIRIINHSYIRFGKNCATEVKNRYIMILVEVSGLESF